MKKLIFLGLLFIVIILYFGCEKDHSDLVFDPTQGLAKPAGIDTVIFSLTNQKITLFWFHGDTTNVVRYHVYMADTSTIFDGYFMKDWYTESDDTTFAISTSYTQPETGDSTRYYFKIGTVNENNFTGPLSDVDSVEVVNPG